MYYIAGAFAGLIAYGIFQIHPSPTSGLHTWQILFLLEGGLSILMAFVTFALLPADLNTAWFLTPRQRSHAISRMQADIGAVAGGFGVLEHGTNVETSITRRDVIDAVTDWPKIITIVFNIFATLPVSAFGTFMPLIVRGLGYAGVEASLMSVSPFAVGAVGLVVFVVISDRTKERSIVVACSNGVAMMGLIVMAVSNNPYRCQRRWLPEHTRALHGNQQVTGEEDARLERGRVRSGSLAGEKERPSEGYV